MSILLGAPIGSEIARDRFDGTGSILSGPSLMGGETTPGSNGHLFVYFV